MKLAHALIALIALVGFAVAAPPAQAAPPAAPRTITVTQEDINSRYWVTHPRRRAVVERSVDLQPGQIVITDVVERRRGEPVTVTATLVPTLTEGRVTWSLSTATMNGQPAPAELQEQINAQIQSSWARYVKQRLGQGRITALTISDDAITVTLETGR